MSQCKTKRCKNAAVTGTDFCRPCTAAQDRLIAELWPEDAGEEVRSQKAKKDRKAP